MYNSGELCNFNICLTYESQTKRFVSVSYLENPNCSFPHWFWPAFSQFLAFWLEL